MTRQYKAFYLRAESEQALIDALAFARYNDHWITEDLEYALDIIGEINEDTTGWPVDLITGGFGKPVGKIPGYHANLLCTDIISSVIPSEIIIPAPNHPVRVWS